MVPQWLENRNSVLTKELMPSSGPAETLEGEMMRAVNRICYRYYNDGDKWHCGYGIETAGPAAAFLSSCHIPNPLRSELSVLLNDSDLAVGENYELALTKILKAVVTYVEGGMRTPNPGVDMLAFEPKYNDNDDNYYDYDYYDYDNDS